MVRAGKILNSIVENMAAAEFAKDAVSNMSTDDAKKFLFGLIAASALTIANIKSRRMKRQAYGDDNYDYYKGAEGYDDTSPMPWEREIHPSGNYKSITQQRMASRQAYPGSLYKKGMTSVKSKISPRKIRPNSRGRSKR